MDSRPQEQRWAAGDLGVVATIRIGGHVTHSGPATPFSNIQLLQKEQLLNGELIFLSITNSPKLHSKSEFEPLGPMTFEKS